MTDGFRLIGHTVIETVDRPGYRYALQLFSAYTDEAVERRREHTDDDGPVVRDIATVDDSDLKAILRHAHAENSWRGETIPDGLKSLLDEVDLFTGLRAADGTDSDVTHSGFHLYEFNPADPAPLSFTATVSDPDVRPDDPGWIELAVRNDGEEAYSVGAGSPFPFGLLFASPTESDGEPDSETDGAAGNAPESKAGESGARGGDSDNDSSVDTPPNDHAGRFLLWQDYTQNRHIQVGKEGLGWQDVAISRELASGERAVRTYEVHHPETETYPVHTAPPGPGQYAIDGDMWFNQDRGPREPESTLSYRVIFDLI